MRAVWIIAKNTGKEIIRDRVLYGLVVFAVLLIGLSLALGQLSFAEQMRMSINFGLAAMTLGSVILAIFSGSTLVSREIEKQTILTLLARPITRGQFLFGKYLGLSLVIIMILFGLFLVLGLTLHLLHFEWNYAIGISVYGALLEALILLALTILFGTITRPMLTVTFAGSLFLIGHWIDDLQFFAGKSESKAFKALGWVVSHFIPNLERFNWRSEAVYREFVGYHTLGAATIHAMSWILVLLISAILIFRRKDFV